MSRTPQTVDASNQRRALVVAVPGLPLWSIMIIALVWGASVVADSAQLSAIVSECADQHYVGTALTAQLAFGFLLTIATMWLVPFAQDHAGWWAAFALLAPGPLLGAWALRSLSDPASRPVPPGIAPAAGVFSMHDEHIQEVAGHDPAEGSVHLIAEPEQG